MKRILFIDLRNTCRSQMAEALFNQFADGWANASSCGTMPATAADPLTLQVLNEEGMDSRKLLPKPVNSTLVAQADVIVLMGSDVFPGAFKPDYIWDFSDPTGKDVIHYRIQRDAIRNRVQELVAELQRLRFEAMNSNWIHPDPLQLRVLTRQILGM